MNIIVCFSWLGNNSLSEKQVLFLLQLHILGLIFRKVRHRTLRRAVTGALFLLLQCFLRCIFLDVLCAGDGDKEHKGSEQQACASATPKLASPREIQALLTCQRVKTMTVWSQKLRGRLGVYAFCPINTRGKAGHVTCRRINTSCHHPRTPMAHHFPDACLQAANHPGPGLQGTGRSADTQDDG